MTTDTKKPLEKGQYNLQQNNSICIYKGQGLYAKCKDCTEDNNERCKLYIDSKQRKPTRSIYTYQERCQNYWIGKFRKI